MQQFKKLKTGLSASFQRLFVFVLVISFFSLGIYTYTRVSGDSRVHAAVSDTLNFQGRVYNSDGSIVDDGLYDFEFKLYTGDTLGGPAGDGEGFAGTNVWTETWNGGNQLRVVNGYFSVNLGDVTTFPTTIEWDQEHWLTMNFSSDGEMDPRIKLTAVPYAFEAGSAKRLIDDQLNGTGTLEWLTLTTDRTISLPDADGTLVLDSTGFVNDGNSFGGAATLGTNDANDLILETGGSRRLTYRPRW